MRHDPAQFLKKFPVRLPEQVFAADFEPGVFESLHQFKFKAAESDPVRTCTMTTGPRSWVRDITARNSSSRGASSQSPLLPQHPSNGSRARWRSAATQASAAFAPLACPAVHVAAYTGRDAVYSRAFEQSWRREERGLPPHSRQGLSGALRHSGEAAAPSATPETHALALSYGRIGGLDRLATVVRARAGTSAAKTASLPRGRRPWRARSARTARGQDRPTAQAAQPPRRHAGHGTPRHRP